MTPTRMDDVFIRICPSETGDVLMVTRPPEECDPEELWDACVTEVVPMFNTQERMIRAINVFLVVTFIFAAIGVVGFALYQQLV